MSESTFSYKVARRLHDSLLPTSVPQTEQQGDGEVGSVKGRRAAATPLRTVGGGGDETRHLVKSATKDSRMSRQMMGGSGGRLAVASSDEIRTFTQNKKPIEFVKAKLLTLKTKKEKGGV
jgi:hypothetical protein